MTNRLLVNPADGSADATSLVRRVVAGDRTAFELLMRQHNRRLYRLARAVLRDPAEAEDALQEAYLSAYRSMSQFRGDASLATWLSRLVLNESLARLRRGKRRENILPLQTPRQVPELDAVRCDDSTAPDRLADRAQLRALLERKLDELPESFRAVFVLRSVEELSVEETAECLSIPPETVRSRHFRARSLLRESLARDLDLAERDLFDFAGARCDQIVTRVLAQLH
jgi:RNA polymerase sigma-70 factor (ECF subfamily)